MSYYGKELVYGDFTLDTFSGTGSLKDFTLSGNPSSTNAIEVSVDDVVQSPSKYTINGTILSFITAPPLGTDNIWARHLGKQLDIGTPADASVSTVKLQDNSVTPEKTSYNPFRKNAIINGDFDIWQRGVTQTTNDYGSDDRWANGNVGSTKIASQQPFTLGQTDVPNNPKYYSRTVVTSSAGASNYCIKHQRIEAVRTFSGESVTISFWAKADSPKNIATEFEQCFGTTGSPSATINGISVTTHALTTSWQKFTTTVTIPSISGKTLGTDGNDYLQLLFWFDAGTSFDSRTNSLGQQSGTFDIAQVQIEAGIVATDFERRFIGDELAMCQRYYEIGSAEYSGYSLVATGNASRIIFSTTKCAVPTLTYSVVNAVNVSTYDVRAPTLDGLSIYSIVTTSAAYIWACSWTADAEL